MRKNMPQVRKITFKQIVLVLFQCFFKSIGITLRQFVWKYFCGLRKFYVGGFLTLCSDSHITYKQSLCPSDFFCSLLSELVCIITRKFARCDFYCETARNYGLKFCTGRFICISIKSLFLLFSFIDKKIYFAYFCVNVSCFEHISWFWIFFACPNLRASDFGRPPVFRK